MEAHLFSSFIPLVTVGSHGGLACAMLVVDEVVKVYWGGVFIGMMCGKGTASVG